jgi:hypothetical protein
MQPVSQLKFRENPPTETPPSLQSDENEDKNDENDTQEQDNPENEAIKSDNNGEKDNE